MGQKKTLFTFICDTAQADNIIQNFLTEKNYTPCESEDGLNIFKCSTSSFKGGLEYGFINSTLYLYVYLGNHKNSSPLDNSFAGSLLKKQYKAMLNPLFENLCNLSNGNVTLGITTNGSGLSLIDSIQLTKADNKEQFLSSLETQNNVFPIIAFLLSMTGIAVLSLGGKFALGNTLLAFIFGVYGLKSKLKALSIISIIISSISTIIFIMSMLA